MAKKRRLDALAGREEAAWAEVESLIAKRNPLGYDGAVALLTDLRDLAYDVKQLDKLEDRLGEIRSRHAGKGRFLERLDRVGLTGSLKDGLWAE